MTEKTILSIDCGTQSLRALLFSQAGNLIARQQVAYAPYVSPRPGWAEQDPEIYWNSLCRACKGLKAEYRTAFDNIAGVGVTTQRASMINVDKNGVPLSPAIIWLDQRKAAPRFSPRNVVRLALKAVHMDEAFMEIQSEGKCNWIRQNRPDIWDATAKYLQVSGFLNYRLTGEFADSVASQIGHLPFNYKKMTWAKRFDLPSLLFYVEPEKLPELIAPGEVLGMVTPAAATATGIPENTPVVACGSDKGCETIGAGVIDQSAVSLSFGTTATIQTTSSDYFETSRFMPPYPAPIPGRYNPEVEIFRGYWMITWFKNEFAYQEVQEAEAMGIPAEEVLNRHLLETEPGAMGLVVQPYWSPGLRHPSAKGAIIGFGDVHKKAHIYRAVIEGLGFGLLEGLHKLEKAGGIKAGSAAVSGGASQSDEICRITADIFNLPMVKGATHETSGLGAAIVTAVGLGIYTSFEEAVSGMVKQATVFDPNPANVDIYQALYSQVYRRMFRALAPLYRNIRAITGYPE
ncbi:MAG: FGGY-family carbohydrate kinase [Thermodesulfobacteriota bacterium]|nr:FGGY-family carbohydrate kinase [Thermodesulfobacteriota bacterium]